VNSSVNIIEHSYSLEIFGSEIEMKIYDEPKEFADFAIKLIYNEALRLQKIFNLFDPESELNELNTKRKLLCSNELAQVIKNSIKYSVLTGGLYDVTKGKQIMQRKNFLEDKDSGCSYKDIRISGNIVELTNPAVIVDLGSIAKGYITDRIADYMKIIGIQSGFIDSRGDLRIFGNHVEIVEIMNPGIKTREVPRLVLYKRSIATSGNYRQFYGSKDKSHIIGDVKNVSVTVMADTLEEADAFATCLTLMNAKNAEKLLAGTNIYAVIIDTKGKVHIINTYDNLLEDFK